MKSFDKFIAAMMGESLTSTGRMWARVGVVVLVVAGLMSWSFGSEISWKHGAFLACLSFVTAFGPEAAYKAWHSDKRGPSVAIALACVPLLAIEFYSHAGWTAGIRGSDIETATVQNARYDDTRDTVGDNARKAKFYEDRAHQLDAEMAALVTTKVAGWTVATRPASPEELDGQIAAKQLEVDNEAKRKGCGPKCEARTNELAHLKALRAKAVEIAKNTEMHTATLTALANARNTAAATEHKSSAAAHQNAFLAKAVTLVSSGSLDPTPHTKAAAEQSANLVMAIAATGLPAFCLFVAGLYRRPEDEVAQLAQHYHAMHAPSHAEPQPSHATATHSHATDTVQPINITLPVNVHHDVAAPIQAPAPMQRRVIGHVRDTAFARRVEQATRAYRHGGATA